MHDVAVIIVGLNARDFIRQCLESLQRADWRNFSYEIIYVDNASTDGTVEMVAERFPGVSQIRNSENLGFCKAANQGAGEADSRYYFFLNDDTIVLDSAIALLVELLDKDPAIGVAGSRLLYPDRSEQWSGRRFPTLLNAFFGRRSLLHRWFPDAAPVARYLFKRELQGREPFRVDWVSAAAMLVRREVFAAVGGFAEDYYYWHEPIICDRIRERGYEIRLHPGSKIIHFEGNGSGVRPYRVQRFHIIDFHRGAYRCYCEHYHLGRFSPLRLAAAVGLATRALLLLVVLRIQHSRGSC